MFEIDCSVIQANELLERVRKNVLQIEEKAPIEPQNAKTAVDGITLSGDDLCRMESDLNSMLENIQSMNNTWYHRDAQLQCRFKLLRPVIIFVKRAIRKTIYWFTQPYVDQQNAFNGAATRANSDSLRVQRMLLEAIQKQQ